MRTILHADLNNFFASVECLQQPELWQVPMAVAGDPAARHGIVLAKNQLAKRFGVKTGEALWQARKKCPDVRFVPPHFERYAHFSRLARELYIGYTDQVESFGMDECWLDVSAVLPQYGSGAAIADKIRAAMKEKLGLTVSVGVSFNKVFAKLGSDLKKPDATTVISPENYKNLVWDLPVTDLLYVGRATEKKLHTVGIRSIGQLAACDPEFLYAYLGKNGLMLHRFANGRDNSQVQAHFAAPAVKSVSHGLTTPRDLLSLDEVKVVLLHLCEKVAHRLRQQRCLCSQLQLELRDCNFFQYSRQCRLVRPSAHGGDLYQAALALFSQGTASRKPLRHLSVAAGGLRFAGEAEQLSLFSEEQQSLRHAALDEALDSLQDRYGRAVLCRGLLLKTPELVQHGLPSSFGAVLDGS